MNWLLLRGLAREQRHWLAFPDVLSRRLPDTQVFFLDLAGAGTENGRDAPTTVEDLAEDLRTRWLPLRDAHAGPWALLGMSLGGMIAMAWSACHPEDFVRAVLASTSAGDLSAPWRRFGLAVLPRAARALVERDPVKRERGIVSLSTSMVPDPDGVARTWATFGLDRPIQRANVLRQVIAGRGFRAPASLAIPTLVVAGAGDRLADPSCARLLASQLGAPLCLHATAGHELALDAPEWLADSIARWIDAPPPKTSSSVHIEPYAAGILPLVVSPATPNHRSLALLLDHIEHHRTAIERDLVSVGAILFRGFDVDGASAFEQVARAIGPSLGNQYLGTSPRNALTEYTFSASELPPHYPIPQHCEMSFVKSPPARIFFSCLHPSSGPGGETPLADFRAVLRDLDPSVRARFEERGVRNIRNYVGPDGGGRFDLWKLKRWDEMFNTTDRDEVTRIATANGFDVTWRADGMLRLVNVQPATRLHPVTGERVWYNHAQVFHLSSVPDEYRRIAQRQGELRYRALAAIASAIVHAKSRVPSDDQAMHCTYGDGTSIPDGDMDRVRDAIWKNMVFFKWRKGDVLVLDNRSVSHGRMPFRGPRAVAVAWA